MSCRELSAEPLELIRELALAPLAGRAKLLDLRLASGQRRPQLVELDDASSSGLGLVGGVGDARVELGT